MSAGAAETVALSTMLLLLTLLLLTMLLLLSLLLSLPPPDPDSVRGSVESASRQRGVAVRPTSFYFGSGTLLYRKGRGQTEM